MKGTRRLLSGAVLAVGLLLLGFALRIHHLGVKDFWWDEAHSWALARLPLVEGVREGLAVLNDPLYIVVLHGWMRLAGQTAFALRYLSVLATLIAAAYVGRVALRFFGRQVASIALLLGAAAPIWVFYAQEVRQYALMPLLMVLMVESVLTIQQGRSDHWRPWIQLAIAEALSLYTHSFMLFAVLGLHVSIAVIWLIEVIRRRKDIGWLPKWMLSQVGVLVLCLPILPVYVNRGTGSLPPSDVGPVDLWNAVWLNWMGIPWEQAGRQSLLHSGAWLVMVGLGVGLVYGWMWPHFASKRRVVPRYLNTLVGIILVGTASTIGFWLVNSKIHPRYLIAMTPLVFLVLAWLIGRLSQVRDFGWPGVAIALALIGGLGVVSVLGLQRIYAGELIGYWHDPTASVAAYLREQHGADDGIITLDPYDFTLDFYDTGPAPIFRAGFAEGIHDVPTFIEFVNGKDQVSIVEFHVERSDPTDITPFYLERFGTLKHIESFESYRVTTYRLDQEVEFLNNVQQNALVWSDFWLSTESTSGGDAVTLALFFEALPDFVPSDPYAIIVRLVDPETGWLVGSVSERLVSRTGATTDQWRAGDGTVRYLIIPLMPGTPPIDVDVEITLLNAETGEAYDRLDINGAPAGQTGHIGIVSLGPAPDKWVYDSDPPFTLTALDTPVLSGLALDWPTADPGGTLGMTLAWQIAPETVAEDAVLRIMHDGIVIAEESGPPLQGRPPADSIPWLDHRVLTISVDAQSGPADIMLVIGKDEWTIGSVEIAGFERITERPDIPVPFEAVFEGGPRLLGYDLGVPDPLTVDDAVTLTLYWETTADLEGDFTVFGHMLGEDGRLIGQHDGVPVNGTRPTSGWVAGEYLIDTHELHFNEPYSGPITIQIGLYDPDTFERLLTLDGGEAVRLSVEGLLVESPN